MECANPIEAGSWQMSPQCGTTTCKFACDDCFYHSLHFPLPNTRLVFCCLPFSFHTDPSFGTAVSDGNGRSHKVNTAVWQRSSAVEPHDGHCAAFGFHLYLLLIWVTFNICTIWGDQIDGKFLINHLCLLPGVLHCFLASQGKSWTYYLSTFREICLSTWRSSLCLAGFGTHKEARGLFFFMGL